MSKKEGTYAIALACLRVAAAPQSGAPIRAAGGTDSIRGALALNKCIRFPSSAGKSYSKGGEKSDDDGGKTHG